MRSEALATIDELKKLHLLKSVDQHVVMAVLGDCPIRELKPDEALIRAGEASQYLYLVLSGRLRVHLSSDQSEPVAIIEAGESVGEIAIMDHQPASANVIADTPTRALVVDEGTLWDLIQRSHAVAYNMLMALAQRLRYGNSVIHQIKKLLREYEYDATVDPLTGLYNRRWLDNMLTRLMQRCRNSHQLFSIIMIDIDFFKQYNDTYGHIAGDRALRALSHCLMNHLRPEDLMTRYGGEELIALLPGSNLEDARQVAERLRSAVGSTAVTLSDGRTLPSLTISLGVAQMHPDDTPERLIAAADAALYRAKRGGRNRVCD